MADQSKPQPGMDIEGEEEDSEEEDEGSSQQQESSEEESVGENTANILILEKEMIIQTGQEGQGAGSSTVRVQTSAPESLISQLQNYCSKQEAEGGSQRINVMVVGDIAGDGSEKISRIIGSEQVDSQFAGQFKQLFGGSQNNKITQVIQVSGDQTANQIKQLVQAAGLGGNNNNIQIYEVSGGQQQLNTIKEYIKQGGQNYQQRQIITLTRQMGQSGQPTRVIVNNQEQGHSDIQIVSYTIERQAGQSNQPGVQITTYTIGNQSEQWPQQNRTVQNKADKPQTQQRNTVVYQINQSGNLQSLGTFTEQQINKVIRPQGHQTVTIVEINQNQKQQPQSFSVYTVVQTIQTDNKHPLDKQPQSQVIQVIQGGDTRNQQVITIVQQHQQKQPKPSTHIITIVQQNKVIEQGTKKPPARQSSADYTQDKYQHDQATATIRVTNKGGEKVAQSLSSEDSKMLSSLLGENAVLKRASQQLKEQMKNEISEAINQSGGQADSYQVYTVSEEELAKILEGEGHAVQPQPKQKQPTMPKPKLVERVQHKSLGRQELIQKRRHTQQPDKFERSSSKSSIMLRTSIFVSSFIKEEYQFNFNHFRNGWKEFPPKRQGSKYSVGQSLFGHTNMCSVRTPSLKCEQAYFDTEFAANNNSLGDPHNKSAKWSRAFNSKYKLLGEAGVSGLALWGAAAAVRLHCPQFLQNVTFQSQKFNKKGGYFVRLFVRDIWKYVEVDDYCPFVGKDALCTRSLGVQMWPFLLEKAYVKQFMGTYKNYVQHIPVLEDVLRELLGCPISTYTLRMKQTAKEEHQQGRLVLVTIAEESQCRLNKRYCYKVSNFQADGVVVDNPLGCEGEPQTRLTQFKDIKNYIVCELIADALYSTITVQQLKGSFSITQLQVNEVGCLSINSGRPKLLQRNTKSGFAVVFNEKNRHVIQWEEGNVSYLPGLEIGKYNVLIMVECAKEAYVQLGFYCKGKQARFERKNFWQFSQCMASAFSDLLLSQKYGKERGVASFSYYQKSTGLLFLTYVNQTQEEVSFYKEFRAADLSRLTLLNACGEAHWKALGKAPKREVEAMRATWNEGRWAITLKPHQQWTMTFKTSAKGLKNQNLLKSLGLV